MDLAVEAVRQNARWEGGGQEIVINAMSERELITCVVFNKDMYTRLGIPCGSVEISWARYSR